MAPSQRRGPWLPQEDQTLLQLVRTQGPNNWVRISQHMKFRSPKQCRERFHQNLKPSLSHKPISADEGVVIERMVNEMGKRWAEIARRLGNRSDNAVKNWWNGSMNRKRRGGLPSPSSFSGSRTAHGRIETPYEKASSTTTPTSDRFSFHLPNPAQPCTSWGALPGDCTSIHPNISGSYGRPTTADPACVDQDGRRDFRSPIISHDPERSNYTKPRRQSLVSRPQLAPIVVYPSHSRTDLPQMSPTPSEISNRTSVGPPSMISDHNSLASTSPKTARSPLLSVPSEFHCGLDTSRSAKSGEYGMHGKWEHMSLQHSPTENGDAFQQQRHYYANLASYDQQAGNRTQLPSPSPRDARMGLQALLN